MPSHLDKETAIVKDFDINLGEMIYLSYESGDPDKNVLRAENGYYQIAVDDKGNRLVLFAFSNQAFVSSKDQNGHYKIDKDQANNIHVISVHSPDDTVRSPLDSVEQHAAAMKDFGRKKLSLYSGAPEISWSQKLLGSTRLTRALWGIPKQRPIYEYFNEKDGYGIYKVKLKDGSEKFEVKFYVKAWEDDTAARISNNTGWMSSWSQKPIYNGKDEKGRHIKYFDSFQDAIRAIEKNWHDFVPEVLNGSKTRLESDFRFKAGSYLRRNFISFKGLALMATATVAVTLLLTAALNGSAILFEGGDLISQETVDALWKNASVGFALTAGISFMRAILPEITENIVARSLRNIGFTKKTLLERYTLSPKSSGKVFLHKINPKCIGKIRYVTDNERLGKTVTLVPNNKEVQSHRYTGWEGEWLLQTLKHQPGNFFLTDPHRCNDKSWFLSRGRNGLKAFAHTDKTTGQKTVYFRMYNDHLRENEAPLPPGIKAMLKDGGTIKVTFNEKSGARISGQKPYDIKLEVLEKNYDNYQKIRGEIIDLIGPEAQTPLYEHLQQKLGTRVVSNLFHKDAPPSPEELAAIKEREAAEAAEATAQPA